MNNAITLPRPSVKGIRARDYILPAAIALACAGAAYAGADTTFDPALQKFTDFLEGSGGKIITVLSLAGGLIALASGRFAMIDNGLSFQLVPWSPSLDSQIGKHISGVMRAGGGVDWSFGRGRGLGL